MSYIAEQYNGFKVDIRQKCSSTRFGSAGERHAVPAMTHGKDPYPRLADGPADGGGECGGVSPESAPWRGERSGSRPRLGYLVKAFPRISETFIINEILEL